MTVEDYYAAVRPKVQGSWNLHERFSDDELDFFVMLFFLAGIVGYASQCNYSAGGTYQDGLARHRRVQGLPAVSIDFGVVKSVGYVAENQGTAERLKKTGHTVLGEEDVLAAIESAILAPFESQLTLGLNTGPEPHWEDSPMARDSRFDSLRYRQSAHNTATVNKAGSGDLAGQIAAATTFDEAVDAIVKAITKKLVDIFYGCGSRDKPCHGALALRRRLTCGGGAQEHAGSASWVRDVHFRYHAKPIHHGSVDGGRVKEQPHRLQLGDGLKF